MGFDQKQGVPIAPIYENFPPSDFMEVVSPSSHSHRPSAHEIDTGRPTRSNRNFGVLASNCRRVLHANSGRTDQTLRGEIRTMKRIGMAVLGLIAASLLVACVLRYLKVVYGMSLE